MSSLPLPFSLTLSHWLALRRAPSLLSCGRYDELFMNGTQEQVESTTLERLGANEGERGGCLLDTYPSLFVLSRVGPREKKAIDILGRARAPRSKSRGTTSVSRVRDRRVVIINGAADGQTDSADACSFKLRAECFVTYARELRRERVRAGDVDKSRHYTRRAPTIIP